MAEKEEEEHKGWFSSIPNPFAAVLNSVLVGEEDGDGESTAHAATGTNRPSALGVSSPSLATADSPPLPDSPSTLKRPSRLDQVFEFANEDGLVLPSPTHSTSSVASRKPLNPLAAALVTHDQLNRPRSSLSLVLPLGAQVETVAHFAGWTAKRVSMTGEIYFEHDVDGTRQLEIPNLDGEDGEDEDEEDDQAELELEEEAIAPVVAAVPAVVIAPAKETPVALTEEQVGAICALEGNSRCCDCGVSHPEWASVAFGVLVCLGCSGFHRSLGTGTTTTKSLELDYFTPTQFQYLVQGGNLKFKQHAVDGRQFARYRTLLAEDYREALQQRVEPNAPASLLRKAKQAPVLQPHQHAANAAIKLSKKLARDSPTCMVCGKDFTVRVRKFLCRQCNKACCASCAPRLNSKPLPQLGLGPKPVRHCSRCYRSPFIDWSQQGLSLEGRKSTVANRKSQVAKRLVSQPAREEEDADTNSEEGEELASSSSMGRRKTIGNALGKLLLVKKN